MGRLVLVQKAETRPRRGVLGALRSRGRWWGLQGRGGGTIGFVRRGALGKEVVGVARKDICQVDVVWVVGSRGGHSAGHRPRGWMWCGPRARVVDVVRAVGPGGARGVGRGLTWRFLPRG